MRLLAELKRRNVDLSYYKNKTPWPHLQNEDCTAFASCSDACAVGFTTRLVV